ncbi:MAG: transcriptional regulator, partial [bacterium]
MSTTGMHDQEKAKYKKRVCKEDRREQILLIASQIFSQKGFNGATTKEIAEQVGVSEAIIFRHFPSKQALYSAILDNKTTELMQPLWLKCE